MRFAGRLPCKRCGMPVQKRSETRSKERAIAECPIEVPEPLQWAIHPIEDRSAVTLRYLVLPRIRDRSRRRSAPERHSSDRPSYSTRVHPYHGYGIDEQKSCAELGPKHNPQIWIPHRVDRIHSEQGKEDSGFVWPH